ncbi:unnamed protein product [Closterium sp. NIES-53]
MKLQRCQVSLSILDSTPLCLILCTNFSFPVSTLPPHIDMTHVLPMVHNTTLLLWTRYLDSDEKTFGHGGKALGPFLEKHGSGERREVLVAGSASDDTPTTLQYRLHEEHTKGQKSGAENQACLELARGFITSLIGRLDYRLKDLAMLNEAKLFKQGSYPKTQVKREHWLAQWLLSLHNMFKKKPEDPDTLPGASESAAALGASESAAAPGASDYAAALGACAFTATGASEALHTFTLDSGTSCCFFRDCTTLTSLAAPVPVSLAHPTGGPIVARTSTVLPCPAVPSGSLSGLHLPEFSTNLLSNAVLQDACVDTFIPGGQRVAICKCSRTGCHLATFTRQPGSGLYTLITASSQVAESGQVAASSRVSASGQLAASCSCRVLSL